MAAGAAHSSSSGGADQQPGAPGSASGFPKSFTEIAVERGYCTAQQMAQALAGKPPGVDVRALLVQTRVLTEDQARACERATRGATIIAGFEILEKIGQGGMGAVFRARQISMDRIVALKILPPKLAQDPAFKQRFLHEAKLSAKLSHLNIINGIDCGESGGYTFFAMEFVDGRTVKQLLKEKTRLPSHEAFAIVRQIAEALVYAESRGMVHRDIKPDNIMLTKDGTAKLCDLGLAKQQRDDSSLTQDGHAVGTPHYISPEQAKGEKNVDSRSDIYSLGATFYHMLSAKTPFDAPTGASVMALHITDEARNPCDFDPLISTAFGQVLCKMMAKSSADRYANSVQLIEDLEAVKAKRVPKAAMFRAKSSCAWPRRLAKYTGAQTVVGEKARGGTGPQPAVPSRAPWVVASAALALVLAVGGYLLFAGRGNEDGGADQALVAQKEPPKTTVPPPSPLEAKTTPPPKAPEPKAKALPPEPPRVPPQLPAKAAEPNVKPPEPGTKAAEPPAKTQEPAAKTQEPPAKTPEPAAKVLEPKTPVAPPEPVEPEEEREPPQPAVTPDLLYARFLEEFKKPEAKGDLRKFLEDLRAVAAKPEFEVARKDVNAELDDVGAAISFEQAALKEMAAVGGSCELNEETARKWQAKSGKIAGYDPDKGLSVDVKGVGLYVTANALPFTDILKNSPDKSPLAYARYLCARGNRTEAADLLKSQAATAGGAAAGSKAELGARLERKLRLMATGEVELRAQAAYEVLAKVAQDNRWRTYAKLAGEFDKQYGKTTVAAEHVLELQRWKAMAKLSLAPPEGLESAGKFAPVKWPNVNACDVEVVVDPDTGNKTLRIEGKMGASLLGEGDKSAVARSDAPPLNLAGKSQIVFRARHKNKAGLPVAFGLMFDGVYYESLLALVPPGGWSEQAIKIEGPVFKSQKTRYVNYDTPLPGPVSLGLFILIYTKDTYIMEIDGISLK